MVMAKRGLKPLKGMEEGGGEGKESHTNIRYDTVD